MLNNDHVLRAGGLIDLLLHGHALDDIEEPDQSRLLRDDGHIVCIPLDEHVALLDHSTIGNGDNGADHDGMRVEFLAVRSEQADSTVLIQNDVVAIAQRHDAQIIVPNLRILLGLDLRLLVSTGGDAADVEGTHGELRSRFTDGLGCDDANGFALLDQHTGSQMATIALGADAYLGFAGQHRTDLHLLETGAVNRAGLDLVEFLASANQAVLEVGGIIDVFGGITADDALTDLHHFFLALVNRLNGDAGARAAILVANNHVLRCIDQLTGHVPGVGSLERSIGKTLTGAVRRDEVLQNGQTLAEARKNRLFDNLTARLGHQTTQTGQLTDLCLVTSGARIHHQANRVVLLLALVGVQRLEHHRTDLIGTMGPDIDHLVVAFLVGDDALLVLLLDLTDLVKRLLDLLLLLSRNDHVVDTDRNTCTGRLLESDFFQLVEGGDCALVADSLIAVENEVTQLALAHHDVGEAQLGRPDLREDHATHGGLNDAVGRIAVDRLLAEVRILETHTIVGLQGTIHLGEDDFFFGTAQNDAFALLAGLARFGSEVIATQGNVLSRRHDRLAARRAENVQRRHHEEAGLQLSFDR